MVPPVALLFAAGLLASCTCGEDQGGAETTEKLPVTDTGDPDRPATEGQSSATASPGTSAAVPPKVLPDPANAGTPTLSLAASLRPVGARLVDAFRARRAEAGDQDPPSLLLNYGASGILKRQVEAGAPVDAVLLASRDEVEELAGLGLVDPQTVAVFATNTLVLASHADSAPLQWRSLSTLQAGEHLAVGNPRYVPAGRYARRVLTHLDLWEALQPQLLLVNDVTAALTYARRGEARAAVVYATDAIHSEGVVITDRAGWEGAPVAELTAGLVLGQGTGPELARAFLAFLYSDEAQALLTESGFGLAPQ